MSTLIVSLFRLVLLAAFTFGFVVLFEHGPSDYVANAEKEWKNLAGWAQNLYSPGGESSGPAPVLNAPSAPAPPAPAAPAKPMTWQEQVRQQE